MILPNGQQSLICMHTKSISWGERRQVSNWQTVHLQQRRDREKCVIYICKATSTSCLYHEYWLPFPICTDERQIYLIKKQVTADQKLCHTASGYVAIKMLKGIVIKLEIGHQSGSRCARLNINMVAVIIIMIIKLVSLKMQLQIL